MRYLPQIDIAKGIGMLLVIIGHCVNKDTVIHNWIFSFHMPLFFFISGFCFNTDKYKTIGGLIQDKGKRLILPYVYFSSIGLAVSAAIPAWRNEITASGLLTDIYLAYPNLTHITSTWFLVSLFICMVIYWVINQIFDNGKVMAFFIILSGSLGMIISNMHSQYAGDSSTSLGTFLPSGRLPLTIDASFTAFVFFSMGAIIRHNLKYEVLHFSDIDVGFSWKRAMPGGVALMILNFIVAIFLNSRVNIHGCMQGNVLYFYIAAFAGIIGILLISSAISEGAVYKFLCYFGRHSLLILGLQSLMVNIWVLLINHITNSSYVLYYDVPSSYGAIGFIIIVVLVYIVCNIVDRIKGLNR